MNNPFDGHILSSSIEQAERLGSFQAKENYIDRGYIGHDYKGNIIVHIARLGWRRLPQSLRHLSTCNPKGNPLFYLTDGPLPDAGPFLS